MANNPLIHYLGYFADLHDDIDMQKVRLKADNGYSASFTYDEDEDSIKILPPFSKANPSLDSYKLGPNGPEYDEDEAQEWQEEGKAQLRDALEDAVKNRDTTVEF